MPRSLLLVAVLAVAGCDEVRDGLPWQSFSIVSTSMEPTFPKGTHVTGVSVAVATVARGDIVIVRHRDVKYATRLAGMPGDRIALIDGVVVLNGKPIGQRAAGRWKITDSGRDRPAAMLTERFPGERRSHRILDDGMTPGDNFAELALKRDEYFVLGDNRDHAADSRYDDSSFGLGLVKGADIVRRIEPDES